MRRAVHTLLLAALAASIAETALPLVSVAAAQAAAQSVDQAPAGWHLGADTLALYAFARDAAAVRTGRGSGRLAAQAGNPPSGVGSANQAIRAEAYRGRRVRVAGYLKTREASAVMAWVRVEGLQRDTLVAFAQSNTADRPITGTTEWQRVEHVVDVPTSAEAIIFGVQLRGGGQVWLDDFEVTVVDRTTPTTDRLSQPSIIREAPPEQQQIRLRWPTLPTVPANLDFEQRAPIGVR